MTDIIPPKSRNDPCPCGSGKRYKACHGGIQPSAAPAATGGLTALMERALAAQIERRLPDAERLYREALLLDPNQVDCLHMLGVVRMQRLDLMEGRALIAKAGATTNWHIPAIRYNYGHLLSGFMSGRPPANLRERQQQVSALRALRCNESATYAIVVIVGDSNTRDVAATLESIAALPGAPSQVLVAGHDTVPAAAPDRVQYVALNDTAVTAQTLRAVIQQIDADYVVIVQAGDTLLDGIGDAVRRVARAGADWGVAGANVATESGGRPTAVELSNAFVLVQHTDRLGAALIADDTVSRRSGNLIWRSPFLAQRLASPVTYLRELVWSSVWHSEPVYCDVQAIRIRHSSPQLAGFWQSEPARFDLYFRDACEAQDPPNPLAPCRQLDGLSFLKRALRLGIGESLSPELISRLDDLADAHPVDDTTLSQDGVDFVGFVKAENGLGESLRLLARSCEAASVPFGLANIALDMGMRQSESSLDAHLAGQPQFRTRVICANPDSLGEGNFYDGALALPNTYDIGYWYWELENLPESWIDHGRIIDELWVATDFVAAAARKVISQPVIKLPPPIIVPTPSRRYTRAEFGLADHEFTFLFTFDFGSFPARKNPVAVVQAFRRAFDTRHRDARLIIKGHRSHAFPVAREALTQAMAADPRITLMESTLTRDEVSGLQSVIDCYVSLHRSEGLGLGMAECMALGKPVIATAYSGNLDFTREDNAMLVDYTTVPIREGEYLEWVGQHWAEPNIDSAAAHMRRLYDDRAFARALGAKGRQTILEEYNLKRAGQRIRTRLEQINANLAGTAHLARRVRHLRHLAP